MKRLPLLACLAVVSCGSDRSEGTSSTGNALTARVVRADGSPAVGDTASLRPDGPNAPLVRQAVLGAQGELRLDQIPDGSWVLEVRGTREGRVERLRLSGSDLPLGAMATGAFRTIRGQVLSFGEAGGAAELVGTGQRASLDSTGAFTFPLASPGSQVAQAWPRTDGSWGAARWTVPERGAADLALQAPIKPHPTRVADWTPGLGTWDMAEWNIDTGDGCPDLCGWGNAYLQSYATDAVRSVSDTLILEARRTGGKWISGSVHTRQKRTFLRGRLEVDAILPRPAGAWALISLQGDTAGGPGWPATGALDLVSFRPDRPDSLFAIAHRTSTGGVALHPAGFLRDSSGWAGRPVRLAMEWNPQEILFLADDRIFHRIAGGAPFDHPFHLAISLGVGGTGNSAADTTLPPFQMRVTRIAHYPEP